MFPRTERTSNIEDQTPNTQGGLAAVKSLRSMGAHCKCEATAWLLYSERCWPQFGYGIGAGPDGAGGMHPLPPRIFFHDLRSRSLIRRFMMSFFDFFIRLFLLIVVVVVVRVKKCTVRNLARGYAEMWDFRTIRDRELLVLNGNGITFRGQMKLTLVWRRWSAQSPGEGFGILVGDRA